MPDAAPITYHEAARFRSHRRYRRMRRRFLRANPLCVRCDAKGIVRMAVEVDHIVPVRKDPSRVADQTNWQSLCECCHLEKTREDDGISPERQEWTQRLQTLATA